LYIHTYAIIFFVIYAIKLINISFRIYWGSTVVGMMVVLQFFSACGPSHKEKVDELNRLSYAYHYRDLDSTRQLARRALALSDDYDAGYAEACNNLAFVEMAKLNFRQARKWLDLVEQKSNNQIELLVADVQYMRICQREAHNKDFYYYRQKAMDRLRRIGEEAANLPPRERQRAAYAHSEFDIVDATYFYYVGLDEPMMKALNDIDADALESDTAQYINYLYNFGSGGAITKGTPEQIAQTEFDYLMQCYMIASSGSGYPYWQANALQAISEHLQRASMRDFLIKNNLPAIQYLNVEQMPDSLLAGNLAQRALNLFVSYGDTYQIAGAYRTLSECYFAIKDYNSAGDCLLRALHTNKAIEAAPDLVASIRERLCLVYSALNDKQESDFNRNIYLDLQEQTRQDRQLEARAALLDENSIQLNMMIAAVLGMIVIVILILYLFDRMRRRQDKKHSAEKLLQPLEEWKQRNLQHINDIEERKEELEESLQMARLHVSDNKRRNLEQRAKVSLVNSITPFIDRMIHEVDRLADTKEPEEVRKERYEYISELTDKINQYNQVLTQWIQMRQGTLSLRIESFPLQPLFDIVQKGKMGFQMKGITLDVQPTTAQVKADRTLTLFMINTIADNARKFTPSGGKVSVSAVERDQYVEVSVADTGKGMDEEQLSHVFDRTYTGGHGFGLLNCKGIIEKYKKVSSIFSVCQIQAESEVGKGSVFRFRLPKGIVRKLAMLLLLLLPIFSSGKSYAKNLAPRTSSAVTDLQRACQFADSAYFCNINGTYQRTFVFADSAIHYLNEHYLTLRPGGKDLMVRKPKLADAAELKWFEDSLKTDFNVILDLRNECAVAALALHDWSLYNSNNKVYTQLFRERSADNTLDDYVRTMQVSGNAKTVAVILLLLLLLQLPVAYYLLYYRHVLSYRYAVDKINRINAVLLGKGRDGSLASDGSKHSDVLERSDENFPSSDEAKLAEIQKIWNRRRETSSLHAQLDEVVSQIEDSLRKGIETSNDEVAHIELTEDELHRVEYENGKLHIANSVLDNCLSTLKHETMYYPSRIRQVIDNNPEDVQSLRELVDYYKSLYTMLSAQAMEQVEVNVKFDKSLNEELLDMIKGKSRAVVTTLSLKQNSPYAVYQVEKTDEMYDERRDSLLFTPLTSDLKCLLCRQIVRELGEVTNLRGCGIQAKSGDKGHLVIEAVLPVRLFYEGMGVWRMEDAEFQMNE